MKALVYTDKEGLKVREVPEPVVGPRQVLLKISNCGICGSDIFLFKSGGLPEGAIMGHELSGTVEATGGEIEGISRGDRVIARPSGCGECKFCDSGLENLCTSRRSIGLGRWPGGFAEFMVADWDMIIPVPERLPLDQASMADQFGSALHGIRTINFRSGENVLVTGAGPIGLCAIMLLKYYGAEKIVVSEMLENRSELALKFGAHAAVSPADRSLASVISEHFGPTGLDCIIECSGNPKATQDAIQCSTIGSRISLVGMCTKPVTFIPFTLFQKHITILGSFGNTQKECIECMDIMASGQIPSGDLITKKVPLEELPAAFDEVIKSKDQIKVMMEL